jgi:hypothetical protein
MSKETIKAELEDLKKRNEAPEWMNWMSYAMLTESYLLGQTPRERYPDYGKSRRCLSPGL